MRTTDSAIAARAGVSRVTLYRHFPDDVSLFRACTLHGLVTWPPPDPRRWARIPDLAERLRTALVELYAYYRVAGPGMLVIGRDLPSMPQALKPSPNRMEALQSMGPFLLEGRPNRGRRRELLGIAIDHALALSTWDSLVRRGGLTDDEAVRLLCAMVDAASRSMPARRAGPSPVREPTAILGRAARGPGRRDLRPSPAPVAARAARSAPSDRRGGGR